MGKKKKNTKKIRRPHLIQNILKKIGLRRRNPDSEYMTRDELLAVLAGLDDQTSTKRKR